MLKSFSKIISLILAIALTFSMSGIATVFAVSTPSVQTFDINDGNIKIVDSGAGYAVTYGSPLKTARVEGKDKPITIIGGTSAVPTSNTITVDRGTNTDTLNLKLSAVYIKPAANKIALNITGTGTGVNALTAITLLGKSAFTSTGTGNGIASAGGISITGAAGTGLDVAGITSISGKTVAISGGTVNATNGISATATVSISNTAVVTASAKGIVAPTISLTGGTVTTAATGALNALGGITTLSGGTLTVNSGTVTKLTVSANGKANLVGGTIADLTMNGGEVAAQNGSKITKAVLNTGKLKIASNAVITNLTKTSGTYIDNNLATGEIPLVQKTFTGLTGKTTAKLSYTNGNTKEYPVSNNAFTAYVPDGAVAFSVITNDNKHFTATGTTGTTIALKESTTPPPAQIPTVALAASNVKYKQDIVVNYTCSDNSSNAFAGAEKTIKLGADVLKLNAKNGYTITPKTATTGVITIKGAANKKVTDKIAITVTPTVAGKYTMGTAPEIKVDKNTGTLQTAVVEAPLNTSLKKLKSDYLPSGVPIKLDGTTETENFSVEWVTTGYRDNTRTKQTFSSRKTVENPMPDLVTFSSTDKKASLEVTLYRNEESSSSSSRDDDQSDSQSFWSDVRDQIDDADKGDKIYAETGKFDKMPTSVLDDLKGKDVTLILERPSGRDITINGKKVKTPPSGLIYYSLSELSTIYKDASTSSSSSSSSSSSKKPSTNTGGGTTTTTPATPKPSSSSVAPLPSSSSSSAAESSSKSSSEEEEEVTSSESSEEDKETNLPAEEPKPEKKKVSPVMAVVIVTAGVAALSGVAALVVLRKRP